MFALSRDWREFAIIASPWLLDNRSAQSFAAGTFLAAVAVCGELTINRREVFRLMRKPGAEKIPVIGLLVLTMIPVAGLVLWVMPQVPLIPGLGLPFCASVF